MVKLAIFDMDGTILNTLDDLAAACNYALGKMGFSGHTADGYKDFIGHGPIHLITRALPENERRGDIVEKTRSIFAAYYAEHSRDATRPYDGIAGVLKSLKDAGVNIAVWTNKPHEAAVMLVGLYFPNLVDMTVGFKTGVPIKPDPAAGRDILARFGATGHETVYIGDSGVDMQTGKNLGAHAVGVSWGFRPKKELADNGADVIIDKAEELLKFIVDK